MRALLAKGASPNVPGQGGRTALHGAAGIGAAETMQALLEAGGKPNVGDEDGNTPLHFAADGSAQAMSIGGAVATIRLLLRAGGDPNRANARGRTPLHVAARSPDGEGAVRALLEGGAGANRKDRSGHTPLHAAVGPNLGRPGVVGALLAGGADPKAANGDGLTVLQLFVRVAPDQGDTAAMLIDAGADPSRKYPNGEAPLHAAIRTGGNRGKVRVAAALLAGGADPCARDGKGYIPYSVAREGGDIHSALSRAGGYDRACDKTGERVAADSARTMQARTRVNVRSGPGTQHDKVGLLKAGQEVRVTGEVGDWLRIEGPQGGEAFVHASLLVEPGRVAAVSPKCAELGGGYTGSNHADCWEEMRSQPGCYAWNRHYHTDRMADWTGPCADGLVSGRGTYTETAGSNHGGLTITGSFRNGKKSGQWVERYDNGNVFEGGYADGRRSGRWTLRFASGNVLEGPVVDGEMHGRWVTHYPDGDNLELDYHQGSKEGRPGVYVTSEGSRHPGEWSDGCFVDRERRAWVKSNNRSWEQCRNR